MSAMTTSLLTGITTFFATIGPIEAAVIFATLTPNQTRAERRRLAARAVLIMTGGPLLAQLGVSIAALQTAGGVVLLMIALDMIFARPTSAFKLTPSEGAEAQHRDDLAVFPLATPLLAGPGAMSAAILLAANAHGNVAALTTVAGALAIVMVVTLGLLLTAHEVSRFLGVTAQRVLIRVFGILLAAIAVQALFNGIGASGLVGKV
jgi:multiple antibiotic resistance protein